MRSFALSVLFFWLLNTQAFAETTLKWDMGKIIPFDYAVIKAEKSTKATGRTMLNIRIVPVTRKAAGKIIQPVDQENFSKESMAATIAAAAKYHALNNFVEIVGVVMDAQYMADPHGNSMLGKCNFFKDGQGFSGKENVTWEDFAVTERGLTKQELTVAQMWSRNRKNFMDAHGRLNEEALSKSIATAMKIKPEQVSIPYLSLVPVPANIPDEVDGIPPLK